MFCRSLAALYVGMYMSTSSHFQRNHTLQHRCNILVLHLICEICFNSSAHPAPSERHTHRACLQHVSISIITLIYVTYLRLWMFLQNNVRWKWLLVHYCSDTADVYEWHDAADYKLPTFISFSEVTRPLDATSRHTSVFILFLFGLNQHYSKGNLIKSNQV